MNPESELSTELHADAPQKSLTEAPQEAPIGFHGNGFELFKIFTLNLLLTIITLGVYRPWAKARTFRYLYASTEVAKQRFQFHGTGKEMLLGFTKAILVFAPITIGYSLFIIFGEFDQNQQALLQSGLYILLMPLILLGVIGSRRYRLARTSTRGIFFQFRGLYTEGFRITAKGLLLSFVTFGFYYPYFKNDFQKYWRGQSSFGNMRFQYNGQGQDVFRIYRNWIFAVLSIFVAFVIVTLTRIGYYEVTQEKLQRAYSYLQTLEDGFDYETELNKLFQLQNIPYEDQERFLEALKATVANSDLEKEVALEKMYQFLIQASFVHKYPILGITLSAYVLIMAFGSYFFFLVIRARYLKYFWDHTQFQNIQFRADFTAKQYVYEIFVRFFIILFTLGLGTPWAVVRFKRFYLSHIIMVGTFDFDQIEQDLKDSPDAIGEGISGFFEIEV